MLKILHWTLLALLLKGLVLTTAFPNPQEDQSSNEPDLLSDILDDVETFKPFEIIGDKPGECNQVSSQANEVQVDDQFEHCSSYNESGHRCVPYYRHVAHAQLTKIVNKELT